VFGESSFFHPAPHVATARCLTAVLALRLPRAPFDLLLRAGSLAAHKFAGNAAAILAERLQATDRWIEEILQQEQDAQVAERWRSFRARMAFDFKPSRWATGVAW
jgi:CRP-like cAMP-binding protein